MKAIHFFINNRSINVANLLRYLVILFFPVCAFATSIPLYEVSESGFSFVELTNGAVFTVRDVRSAIEWDAGDQVELIHANGAFHESADIVEGVPVKEPIFLLLNYTQQKYVLAYLSGSPDTCLVTFVSMNSSSDIVTLSDSTLWTVREIDQRFVDDWDAGDIILIGKNIGVESQSFNRFLYNVTRVNLALANEELTP